MSPRLRFFTSVLLCMALTGCKAESGDGPAAASAPLAFPITPLPSGTSAPVTARNTMDPNNWEIGPIINGKNSSVGMPLHPVAHPAGWAIELPRSDATAGHAHYISMRYGSLAGKSRITIHYHIQADPGVTLVPTKSPGAPGILTLYFQRAGDDWSAQGKYEAYRWWASFKSHVGLVPGEYETTAELVENWTAVMNSSATSNPAGFSAAVNNADRVGFTLGGGDGLGHGIYATGPARIVVTDFRIE